MSVQFNQIPGNLRVPLFYAEFNPGGTPYQSIARLLVVGQKTSAGSATANIPIQWTGNEEALFGSGSMLVHMLRIARKNAPFQEIWALPLADNGAGVAASGEIVISTLPSYTGTMTIYIGPTRVQIAVSAADTKALIQARLTAAINAITDLPVTATAVDDTDDDTITITAKHKGTLGNSIYITTNLMGDESPLAAQCLTITAMASGATDPVINTALANLGDEEFDWIAMAYSDTTNIGHMAALLNDTSGRWSPISQLYGHCITVKNDTQANLSTYGNARNDQHLSVMGYYKSVSYPWEWAAAIGAQMAAHLQDAPELSRPLQTLPLLGIWAPLVLADRFNLQQRQVLYYDGISGYHVRRDGTVCIDRLITTRQTNDWGSPDATWLDVETMAQNMFAIRFIKQIITNTWGRAALRDENPYGVQGVATPEALRDTIVHAYKQLSALNVVENEGLFEDYVVVERDQTDANRVNVFLPMDVVNQLRIFAVNATTYLQYAGSNLQPAA